MNKVERIEQIEKELAILKQEVKEENKFKFFPQVGDKYWTFTNGKILEFSNSMVDVTDKAIAYKTWKEAEKARDIAIAKHKLRQIIEEKNYGWKPNWKNYKHKYTFTILENSEIKISAWGMTKCYPNWMYIKDKKTAQWIFDNYMDLIKTILGE